MSANSDGDNTQGAKGLPELGERLKAARERAGYRQRDVENMLGTSNVSRWEAGSHRMYVNDLLRLAVLYGLSLDEMVGPVADVLPDDQYPAQAEDGEIDRKLAELRVLQEQLAQHVREIEERVARGDSRAGRASA